MVFRHFVKLPEAYSIEQREDGTVNVWLCKQVDSYVSPEGVREYDVDVRVVRGVRDVPELEADMRMRWKTWWERGSDGEGFE